MGKLNLLQGAFTGTVGELVGSRWRGEHVLRSRTWGKAPPTPAQTAAVRKFEHWIKCLRLVYAEIGAVVDFNPPKITYLNWLCGNSKETFHNFPGSAGEIIVRPRALNPMRNYSAFFNSSSNYVQISGELIPGFPPNADFQISAWALDENWNLWSKSAKIIDSNNFVLQFDNSAPALAPKIAVWIFFSRSESNFVENAFFAPLAAQVIRSRKTRAAKKSKRSDLLANRSATLFSEEGK